MRLIQRILHHDVRELRPCLWRLLPGLLVAGLVAAGVLLSCADSKTHMCINGVRCPADTMCVEAYARCAPPEMAEPCIGIEEHDPCSYLGHDVGICLQGVCELDDCAVDIDCNDNNACTRDTCQGERCQYESLDGASCNDGNFCNGADTCAAGECKGHSGDPCTGSNTYCDPDQGVCAGCIVNSDCPEIDTGEWGQCAARAGADVCDPVGIQSRNTFAYVCEPSEGGEGICKASEGVETRDCELSTEGLSCNDSDACTMNDQCAGNACQGQSRNCDDGNECTSDSCDTMLGCQNAPVAAGRSCGAGLCDGMGTCMTCDNVGGACNTPNPCEIGQIQCIDGEPQCVTVDVAPAGTVCRSAAGVCDVAEVCTGVTNQCPADQVVASGVECRSAAGVCDVAEVCTGTSASCPADNFAPASQVCQPAADACDLPETCTGSSASCPIDVSTCAADEYCFGSTCQPRPRINSQGGEGEECADTGTPHPSPSSPFLSRVIFRGRPGAPFRYFRRHVSCPGSFFVEHPNVPCDGAPSGQLDNTGQCIYTISNDDPLTECPDTIAGRWEIYMTVDGEESNHDFGNIYNSSTALSCPFEPRIPGTCAEATNYCPCTGACNTLPCPAPQPLPAACVTPMNAWPDAAAPSPEQVP